MADVLKIALVADIHHGREAGTKLGTAALELMQSFAAWVNTVRPALVVDLGDRINNREKEEERRWTRDVAMAFRAIERPCVHLLGNHDAYRLSREESEELMETTLASHSRDLQGYHLVFWNSAVRFENDGFHLTPADLAWLEADLAATDLPTLLFSHLPLDNGSMLGNYYFEKAPQEAHYAEGAAAREIIERSGKVIACVAGHTHWNAHNTIDGIHYLTIHSLTESFTTHPDPTGAYGILNVDRAITVEVFGKVPALVRLPIKPLGHHWKNRHREYGPRPGASAIPDASRIPVLK